MTEFVKPRKYNKKLYDIIKERLGTFFVNLQRLCNDVVYVCYETTEVYNTSCGEKTSTLKIENDSEQQKCSVIAGILVRINALQNELHKEVFLLQ
jgi:hypothetical protein